MDTTPQDTTTQETTTQTFKILGDWPDVDVIVLQDYKHSAAQATFHEPKCFLRLHMDIQIKNCDDLDKLRKLIDEGKAEELFKMIEEVAGKYPGSRGRAMLIAALGLDPNHKSESLP